MGIDNYPAMGSFRHVTDAPRIESLSFAVAFDFRSQFAGTKLAHNAREVSYTLMSRSRGEESICKYIRGPYISTYQSEVIFLTAKMSKQ